MFSTLLFLMLAVPPACPVTRPPIDPFPLNIVLQKYGTSELWVTIPLNGEVKSMTIFGGRDGYDARKEVVPRLSFAGKCLEESIPLPAVTTNGMKGDLDFMVSHVSFPETGCWDVTVHYIDPQLRSHELNFTIFIRH